MTDPAPPDSAAEMPAASVADKLLDEVDLAGLSPGAAFEAIGVELEVTGVAAGSVDGRSVVLCDVTIYGVLAGDSGSDSGSGSGSGSGSDSGSDSGSGTGPDAGRCYAARLYVDGGAYYFSGLPPGAADAVAMLFRGAPRVVLL